MKPGIQLTVVLEEKESAMLSRVVFRIDGCSDRSALQTPMEVQQKVFWAECNLCQRLPPGRAEADSREADRRGS